MPVLIYHAVGEEGARPYSVSIEAFKEQIKLVKEHFQVIRLQDVPSRLAGGRPPAAAITFDDAFSHIRDVVHPILEEMEVPYTVFVPTGYMGKDAGAWAPDSLPIMDPEDLRTLLASGLVDIGSHSVTHPNLGELSSTDIGKELCDSKAHLEEVLGGAPVRMFSFPFGQQENFPSDVEGVLRQAGYDLAVTTRFGAMNSLGNVLTLNRVGLGEEEGPGVWLEKLLGMRDWLAIKERAGHLLRRVSLS